MLRAQIKDLDLKDQDLNNSVVQCREITDTNKLEIGDLQEAVVELGGSVGNSARSRGGRGKG